MEKEKVLEIINENEGKIFSAIFVKKDGTLRKIICRCGVKKYLKGIGLKFNPIEKGLLPVFDMEKEEYRFINLKTIKELTVSKTHYYTEE